MASLKGQRRQQLMGGRTKRIGKSNLWLVYSHKMNADLALGGNNEMLHWLSELEINPNVRHFKHDQVVEIIDRADDSTTTLTATVVYVELSDGSIELHQIDTAEHSSFDNTYTPVQFKRPGEDVVITLEGKLVYVPASRLKRFNDESFEFWMQISSYVALVRGYDLQHQTGMVGSAIAFEKEGTMRSLLAGLAISDLAIAMGAICRMILAGTILVASNKQGFGYNTRWWLK